MSFNEQLLATGSGVIAKSTSGTKYVITAWHNFSGRHPETQAPLSATCGLPNRVEIEGCGIRFSSNLYSGSNDPNTEAPAFMTHGSGSLIDVTILPVPNAVSVYYPLDSSFLTPRLNSQLPLRVGQTCYILGFPKGLIHRPFDGAIFPVWKTGHIASEPSFAFEGQPKLLVDATTREGMSGAMVVVTEGIRNRLVGIYAGRHSRDGNREFTLELGWVYWSNVIGELINLSRGA